MSKKLSKKRRNKRSSRAARTPTENSIAKVTSAANVPHGSQAAAIKNEQPARSRGGQGAAKAVRKKRKLPNWPVLVLSTAGALLSAFLTVSAFSGEALPYCSVGSDCDIVQSSRWANVLGMPVAFWGLLVYVALAWIALRLRRVEWHWKFSWMVALSGLAVSIYLTVISVVELEATCSYCLASLGIMTALFAVICYQSPKGLEEFTWPGWLVQTGGVTALLLVLLHLNWIGVFDPAQGEEDPYLRELAIHLDTIGAQFYGAFWCPSCDRQKEAFTASAFRLPYIECSPNGRNSPTAAICSINGITTFPTWIIDDRPYEGFQKPEDLARHSDFTPSPAPSR